MLSLLGDESTVLVDVTIRDLGSYICCGKLWIFDYISQFEFKLLSYMGQISSSNMSHLNNRLCQVF